MQIGPLRHRVTIQEATITRSSSGQEIHTWGALDSVPTVWADVRPAGGAERFVSGAEQQLATLTHRVTIRYRSDLTNAMRVVWDGKQLDIENIQDPSGKRAYTVLLCREVQA